jgi:hypothetical protein
VDAKRRQSGAGVSDSTAAPSMDLYFLSIVWGENGGEYSIFIRAEGDGRFTVSEQHLSTRHGCISAR